MCGIGLTLFCNCCEGNNSDELHGSLEASLKRRGPDSSSSSTVFPTHRTSDDASVDLEKNGCGRYIHRYNYSSNISKDRSNDCVQNNLQGNDNVSNKCSEKETRDHVICYNEGDVGLVREVQLEKGTGISAKTTNSSKTYGEASSTSSTSKTVPTKANSAVVTNACVTLTMMACVLHLRGKNMVEQPVFRNIIECTNDMEDTSCDEGVSFCWNGECYGYDCKTDSENDLYRIEDDNSEGASLSDTDFVLAKVVDALKGSSDYNGRIDDKEKLYRKQHETISRVMGSVHGEYSFLLHHRPKRRGGHKENKGGTIYFGKDVMGRRSLLFHRTKCATCKCFNYVISSVAPQVGAVKSATASLPFLELFPGRVYRLDLDTGVLSYVPIVPFLRQWKHGENILCDLSMRKAPIYQLEDGKIKHSDDIHSVTVPSQNAVSHSITCPISEKDDNGNVIPASMRYAANEFHKILSLAVKRRVIKVPSVYKADCSISEKQGALSKQNTTKDVVATVGVLFSGGLDSVVLAALANKHIPMDQPIDLLNVAFSIGIEKKQKNHNTNASSLLVSSPDRIAAIVSYEELCRRHPQRRWRLVCVDVTREELLHYEMHICRLIEPLCTQMDFNVGAAFWFASRGIGTLFDGQHLLSESGQTKIVSKGDIDKSHLKIPPLTIPCGMVGCSRTTTVESKMRNTCVFIDLCKVCCHNNQKPICRFLGQSARLCPLHNNLKKKLKKKTSSRAHVVKPEQEANASKSQNSNKTGGTFSQLDIKEVSLHTQVRNADPGANNAIKINAGPSNTEKSSSTLDLVKSKLLSISTAKVLLVGSGADEQMAGYSRHRTAYTRKLSKESSLSSHTVAAAETALSDELEMDMSRLWIRNLGRDDRCISDHGKEARFPFLDESVVSFLKHMPIHDMCDMERPMGIGDKMILRLVAKKIGVEQCSVLAKRAIQFGSRIAKVSESGQFGNRRDACGTTVYHKTVS